MSAVSRIVLPLLVAGLSAGAAPASSRAAPAPIHVVYAQCPASADALGCLHDGTIYVTRRGDTETLQHEQGHAFALRFDDATKRWFARRVGMPHRPWDPPAPGMQYPGERFADAYAACKLGVRVSHLETIVTGYGYVIHG